MMDRWKLTEDSVWGVRTNKTGYAVIQWAVKDNHLRNSKHGQAQGLFP